MTLQPQQDAIFDETIDRIVERMRATAAMKLEGFPHYADVETGRWTTSPDGFWTGGFWPGCLWLSGYYTGDRTLWAEAAAWTAKLESRIHTESVFKGFLFHFAGSLGSLLACDETAEVVALAAARSLKQAFNHKIGLIPLGAQAEEAHTVGANETNIDGIAASLVLIWAAETTGDSEMREIAVRHALKSGEYCVRNDGSVCQSASFDGTTGALIRNYTHKGYSESSTWTRAQGWAMLGFSYLSGVLRDDPRLLAEAERVSDWWIDNIPEDLIARWDFDAPLAEAKRDTSGTAIAAASLLRLAHAHPHRRKALKYRRFAQQTVNALTAFVTPTTPDDTRPPGILTEGCFDYTRGEAIENELIWGDYFLLEALGVLTGLLPIDRLYPAQSAKRRD